MAGYQEYNDENELIMDFRRHWADPETQRRLPSYIFNSLLDDAILTVVSDVRTRFI